MKDDSLGLILKRDAFILTDVSLFLFEDDFTSSSVQGVKMLFLTASTVVLKFEP